MNKTVNVSLSEVILVTELTVLEASSTKTGKNPDGSEWTSKTCGIGFPTFKADEQGKPVEMLGKLNVKTDVDVQVGKHKFAVAISAYNDRRTNRAQASMRILKVLK